MANNVVNGSLITSGFKDGSDGWGNPMNQNMVVINGMLQPVVRYIISNNRTANVNSEGMYLILDNSLGDDYINSIGITYNSDWYFINAKEGYSVYCLEDKRVYKFTNSTWVKQTDIDVAISNVNSFINTSNTQLNSIINNNKQLSDNGIASINSSLLNTNQSIKNLSDVVDANKQMYIRGVNTLNDKIISNMASNTQAINTTNSVIDNNKQLADTSISGLSTRINNTNGRIDNVTDLINKNNVSINSSITAIQKLIDANISDISGLRSKTDTTNSNVDTLNNNINAIDKRVSSNTNNTSSNTSAINSLNNIVNNNKDSADKGLSDLNTALATTNKSISDTNVKVNSNTSDISFLKSKTDNTNSDVSNVKDSINTLNNNITTVNSNIDKVSQTANSIRSDLNTLSSKAILIDSNGLVPADKLPSFVDDVLEFDDQSKFPTTGESGKIYIDKSSNITYRWGGSVYIKIASGEVTSVNGNKGIVTLTKNDIGLSNVDNTSDAFKNVATANTLNTPRNINGVLFDGSKDIVAPFAYIGNVSNYSGVPWNALGGVYKAVDSSGDSRVILHTGSVGGSTPSMQIMASYKNGGLWYRSSRDSLGFESDWTKILTSSDGNAQAFNKLSTARNINITGDGSATTTFDGSADANLNLTLANSGVTSGTYGSYLKIPNLVVNSKGLITKITEQQLPIINDLSTGGSNNLLSAEQGKYLKENTVPLLDFRGKTTGQGSYIGWNRNFGSGRMDLINERGLGAGGFEFWNGKDDNFNSVAIIDPNGNFSGNASTANKLSTSRNINVSGDVIGSANFDGSSDITINVALPNIITSGTYGSSVSIPSISISESGLVARVKENPLNIINNLTTGGSTNLLSAEQGKVLQTNKLNSNANAVSASKLNTPRNINGVSFDGTSDINISDSTKFPTSGGIVTGDIILSNDNSMIRVGNDSNVGIIKQLGYAGFIASSTKAPLDIRFSNTSDPLSYAGQTFTTKFSFGSDGTLTANTFNGNAITSSKLYTPRTISISGDALGSTSFDGSSDTSINIQLVDRAITDKTYGSSLTIPNLTINNKGIITSATESNISVVNDLTTGGTTSILSAEQGKILQNTKLGINDTAAAASKLAKMITVNGVGFDGTSDISVPSEIQSVARGSNLNGMTPGLFYAYMGSTVTGVPLSEQFSLINLQYSQMYLGIESNRLFFRSKSGSSWTDWKEVQTNTSGSSSGAATSLATPRNINGVAFDGTTDITIPNLAKSQDAYLETGAGDWKTSDFISWLTSLNAFTTSGYWSTMLTWSTANNKIITDTGIIDRLQLAGAVLEVFGTSSSYYIRVSTNPTLGNNTSTFTYTNYGSTNIPRWIKNITNEGGTINSASISSLTSNSVDVGETGQFNFGDSCSLNKGGGLLISYGGDKMNVCSDAIYGSTFTINSSGYTGNAASATKLVKSVNINGTPFDGSKDISITDPVFQTVSINTALNLGARVTLGGPYAYITSGYFNKIYLGGYNSYANISAGSTTPTTLENLGAVYLNTKEGSVYQCRSINGNSPSWNRVTTSPQKSVTINLDSVVVKAGSFYTVTNSDIRAGYGSTQVYFSGLMHTYDLIVSTYTANSMCVLKLYNPTSSDITISKVSAILSIIN